MIMLRLDTHTGRFITIVLVAVLFLAINVLSTTLLTYAQVDLTDDRLYTLSDGTRSILDDLDEPVRLRFYFSESVAMPYPAVGNYGRRVANLLKRYESLAGGRIDLRIVDPAPFSPAEDEAVAAGLTGIPTASGETLYFGLAGTNSTDGQRVIPFFNMERERFLEYDLTRMVHELAHPERPVLALVSSLPLEYGPGGPMAAAQGQSQPYYIYEQMRETFDVRSMGNVFDSVPDDVDVLMIAHPGELGAAELYAIDQYVLNGGRTLVFLDPYLESAATMQSSPDAPTPDRSTLGPLLEVWGIAMVADRVVADRALAHRVSVPDNRGARRVTDYPVWLALTRDQLDEADLVTADLDSINMASPGALVAAANASTRFEPLMVSSRQSMLMNVDMVRGEQDPDVLTRAFTPDKHAHVLAARLTGPAGSAFDGPPAPAVVGDGVEDDEGIPGDDIPDALPSALTAHRSGSDGDINVIVVADADMLEDRFWLQMQDFLGQRVATPLADNGAFVLNAVENLSGSSDLISLRSRGVSRRPFTLVDSIRREAEERYAAEEQRLEDRLAETERRLAELEQGTGPDSALLDQGLASEIEGFRQDMIAIRKDLRDVQHNLHRDIEALGALVKFVNIALVPLVVAVIAFLLGGLRRRRLRVLAAKSADPRTAC